MAKPLGWPASHADEYQRFTVELSTIRTITDRLLAASNTGEGRLYMRTALPTLATLGRTFRLHLVELQQDKKITGERWPYRVNDLLDSMAQAAKFFIDRADKALTLYQQGNFAAVEATVRSLSNCAVSVLTEMAQHRVQFKATNDLHRLADEMEKKLAAEARRQNKANRPD